MRLTINDIDVGDYVYDIKYGHVYRITEDWEKYVSMHEDTDNPSYSAKMKPVFIDDDRDHYIWTESINQFKKISPEDVFTMGLQQ